MAIKKYKPKSFLLSGGVAANEKLRELMKERVNNEKLDVDLFFPHTHLCTDNAAVVAAAAYYLNEPVEHTNVVAIPDLPIVQI